MNSRITQSAALLLASVLTSLAGSMLGGCGSSRPAEESKYADLYRDGKYAEAYAEASRASRDLPSGRAKDEASLVAGEAAYAINKDADSERFLRPLLDNQDAGISGHASATVGLIAQSAGRHGEAARLLTSAGEKLDGVEAGRAWLYAGDSLKATGKADESQAAYAKAEELAGTDPKIGRMIADRKAGGSIQAPAPAGAFAIQVGAYSTEQRAQQAVDRLRDKATVLNIGSPRIVPVRSSGKTLYAVQVGGFSTREQAQAVATKLGTDARPVKTGS